MILFMCIWQTNALHLLTTLFSWTSLHLFFTASLSHIALVGHVGNCCTKKGKHNKEKNVTLCEKRMFESVRALLDLTYAVTLPVWAAYLLLTVHLDVSSHAFLNFSSLGYNSYATYWAVKDYTSRERKSEKDGSAKTDRVKLLFLVQYVFSTAIVITNLRVLSGEMNKWKNSIVPIMLDMHPSSTWSKPSVVQRKALSNHLLSKSSDVGWLLTLNLMVHEFPNIFYFILKLLRISRYQTSQMKECVWTTSNYAETVQAAASLGTVAWRRERGMGCSPTRKKTTFEQVLSFTHRLVFFVVRIVCGFFVLNRILYTDTLVRDTSFIVSALLYHGFALYLLVGILSYTVKENSCPKKPSKRNLSYHLVESFDDEWLRCL